MTNLINSIQGNKISQITYHLANRTSGIFDKYHLCDFAIVFEMYDGFCWHICFIDDYDFQIKAGDKIDYGRLRKDAVETYDATYSLNHFIGLKIQDVSLILGAGQDVSLSECKLLFENGTTLNIFIGEKPEKNGSIPIPLEYATPGFIYVFFDEELHSEIFMETVYDEFDDEQFKLPAFNFSNSAGIKTFPYLLNDSDEIDLANSVFSEIGEKLELESEPSENKELIQNCLNNCEVAKQYTHFDVYSSYRVISEEESHLMLVGLSYTLDGGKLSHDIRENQILGVKILDRDYGHILIRPETIEDKFRELFKKKEKDFKNNPRFSFHYYVLHESKYTSTDFETEKRLDLIYYLKNVTIEVFNRVLIVKFPRSLNLKDCEEMIWFLKEI